MVTAVVLSVAKRVLLRYSMPNNITLVTNKAINNSQINGVNKVKRQRKKMTAPEPVWVPCLTEYGREAVEDLLRLREFTLRFNPILNIGVRNLEELDDPSSLHDSSTKAILLALLDIIGVEEEAHVKHVYISPQEIQIKLKAIQGLGLNWSKIIPMLEDLQALVPQDHPFYSLPKVEKRDSSYNIRGGRTQCIDAISLLPMLLHLINVVCNGGSVRQELEVGEEQARKARSDYHAAVKNASDRWNEQKQVFLDAKPEIQNKGESKADEWSMQYQEAEKRYKERIRDLQSYFRVEINSCASRFEPLGVDTDGRVYYLPSSLGPFRGKKDRLPSDKERLGFRRWGWFIAVYGKPGTQIQHFGCDYSDDVDTNVKLREEGWWGFADVSEIRKLSKWLLSRAETEDEGVAPTTVGKLSPAPRSQLNRMKTLAKAINEFADFIDWRLQRRNDLICGDDIMEPYSEHKPVPTTEKYLTQMAEREKTAVEEPSEHLEQKASSEKKDIMDKMVGPKEKPVDKVNRKRGEHTVKDPVTGRDVKIRDAEFDDLREEKDKGLSAYNPGNITRHPYLPPRPVSLTPFLRSFDYLQLGLTFGFVMIWFFLAFPPGRWWLPFTWPWLIWISRTLIIGITAAASVASVSFIQRRLEKEIDHIRLDMYEARGEKFAQPIPESVEWMNMFIQTMWGLVNPELFVFVADMIEDVMQTQQSLPAFVDAVRISDMGQGSNPIRILSVRALSDQPTDNEYPRDSWIDQGTGILQREAENALSDNRDEEQSGNYVACLLYHGNFEVAFAYQSMPGHGEQARAKNIHLLIEFFLGLYDWLHIPIPVWIQLDGLVGTVRLRLQFISEPPFIRNVTLTLMGLPAIEASAIPMSRALPNVLDLPLISRFAKTAIAASMAEYLAPKSMTINVQELLSATAIGDTRALGVFIITIHHAKDLCARDSNGKSDPYIVLAYAKFGKPQYSTRIILGDLNPSFEETTALLVTPDEVKSDEELAIMLWDSDKRRIKITVKDLMRVPNKMFHRTDRLMGFEDADSMPGTLSWSINRVRLLKVVTQILSVWPTAKDSAEDPSIPDVQKIPPDPNYPSGILSLVIHHISNLECQNLKGTSGKDREGQAGQDTDEPTEQTSNLPSAYCEIIINDDLIYKTRVKQYTSMPFFEAGTERFIRDWRNTVVRLTVRDARLREKDPILGIVNLDLKDLFRDASEITRLYSITEGIGFGSNGGRRMSVSLLFRSVELELPRHALGWETATIEVLSPITLTVEQETSFRPSSAKLIAFTSDSKESIPASVAETKEHGIAWNINGLRLPVYNRYSSSLTFELGKSSVWDRRPDATAVLWLNEVVDDEIVDVKIPVIVGKDLRLLRQNFLSDFTASTHDYETVGFLSTKIKLDRGLDEYIYSLLTIASRTMRPMLRRKLVGMHTKPSKHSRRRKGRLVIDIDNSDHIEGEAILSEKNAHAGDDGLIDKNEKKAMKKAHKRQLANRQRGIHGFRPYRTAIWMKEGIRSRIVPTKNSERRDSVVQSEA
ncbi:hypothetical protein Clacol_000585 [Clathrus columnatus]|uniref:C2 domain-containing protein n=1 Tax=Clathrus columnatus TaxID=1419009 RepID=A0AAV4ZZF4_9AGAM|nr:hypothetical protein Clacol_000585 [Clathrus columnatus]